MNSTISCAVLAGLCALSLSACIDSKDPILTDAQPVFGPRLNLQLYTLRKGVAEEPEKVQFAWNGKVYSRSGGGMKDVGAITVHPFEAGDYILQVHASPAAAESRICAAAPPRSGAYLVIAIDEADADEAIRAANCTHPGGTACRVATREQLFALARATAAQHIETKADWRCGCRTRRPSAVTTRRCRRARPNPQNSPAAFAPATAPRWRAPSR